MAPVHIGCSGWSYTSWRGAFYPASCPQSRWLEYYASVFDTVEVNATFYRLPTRGTVASWVARTPPGFRFAVKASRYLTHMKRLTDMEQGVTRLWERLEPLVPSPKLGPVLWQLPERFHRDDARLAAALERLPTANGERHAFEFRHPSWFVPEVFSLLREHAVALCIGDIPERPFQVRELTAEFTILRFHYGRRGGRGNYSERELAAWAAWIATCSHQAEVFCYFNNDWEAFAPRNAQRLRELLSKV